MPPAETLSRPTRVEETIVDLFVPDAQRLRLRAGSVRLPGVARGGDRESLFLELAREMLRRASADALVPRTRAFLDDGKVPSYDGVIHFERELAWRRWRRRR